MSDDDTTAFFKPRRERILARSGARDVQSEVTTPRSPKLITLPQSASKSRSSSVTKEAPEGLRHIKVHSSAGIKVGETGRRSSRSKEKSTKETPAVSSRSQSGRDSVGLKKANAALLETEQQLQQKEQKSPRSSSERKIPSSNDRDGTNKAGPGEVIVLRSRSKRVTYQSQKHGLAQLQLQPPERLPVEAQNLAVERRQRRGDLSSASAPTMPRGSRNRAEHGRRKDEQGSGTMDHVRVTDGDALDQSNIRSPLVGLTNRLQSSEASDLDRDSQGVKTPRAGILVKRTFANQETDLAAEIIEIPSERVQLSPVSVLVQQLWDELRSLPTQKPSDHICDSLYNVLQKDLVLPRNSWTQFNNEIEELGLEVEKMIDL